MPKSFVSVSRNATLRAAAVACLVFTASISALLLVRGGPTHFFTELDPKNALGVCFDGREPKLLCDFANVYYPQGVRLRSEPVAVTGFYYSPFFATCMLLLSGLGFEVARGLWFTLLASAVTALVVLPLLLGVLQTSRTSAGYAVLVALSLPILHDSLYGQVSSVLCVLIALSFIAYGRSRPALSAVLLGLATAIKFYPALFALYYLARRDLKTGLCYALTVGVCVVLLPWLALGSRDYLALSASIAGNLQQLSHYLSRTHYSNAALSVLKFASEPWFGLGRAQSIALGLSLALGLAQLLLMLRAARRGDALSSLLLGFSSLPFVVRSCWMHYFVFLPLLQVHVLSAARVGGRRSLLRWCSLFGSVISATLIAYPYFALFPDADAYYRSGMPFWATLALLPGLALSQFGNNGANMPRPASQHVGT